jgi:hypothetical protein
MSEHDDEFLHILYNGYTEFYFKENGFNSVGYKLKSDIKFCQPIINNVSFSNEYNRLHLDVQLYKLDRGMKKDIHIINKPDPSFLYKTISFVFDANTVVDKDIIDDFEKNGLELHIMHQYNESAFVNELKKHAVNGLRVLLTSFDSYDTIVDSEFYRYDIHSSDYTYCIDSQDDALVVYSNAIDALSSMLREPTMLCMGRVFHSINYYADDQKNLYNSKLEALDPENQVYLYNLLLSMFPEECNTYLYINMPDLSVSSSLDILTQSGAYSKIYRLNEQYNCDLFFGYATDIINTSFQIPSPRKVFYSAALLSFYQLILSQDAYLTNNFIDLNIANEKVKVVISEPSARKLQDNRCNSMVLFDTGHPSVYGDRSLSTLPNLRYSHVSRNFVAIRRMIHNYIETKKFILNTDFNIDSCITYIKLNILNDFKSKGVISDYNLEYTSDRQTIHISIILLFPYIADSIELNFTI